MLPTIEYLRPNFTLVNTGPLTLWFSYKTFVAFAVDDGRPVVRENEYGLTTGKHLNQIDGGDKGSRVDSATFQKLWDAVKIEGPR